MVRRFSAGSAWLASGAARLISAAIGNAAFDQRAPAALRFWRLRRSTIALALLSSEAAVLAPSAQDLMNEGDRERAAGAYDKANLAYLRAHFVDRDSLAPLERIAYLALRSDGLVASRLFRELLREAPGDASLHLGLAYSEIATGNVEDAREPLERAIEVDPDSTAAHAGLGG